MQTINQKTAAQRMAQWLATGGALDAAANEESGRDDGLAAGPMPTAGGYCNADDGLQALLPTMRGLCHADDGLTVGGYSISFCPVMAPERAATR